MIDKRIEELKKELKELNQKIIDAEKTVGNMRVQFIRRQGALAELEDMIKEK